MKRWGVAALVLILCAAVGLCVRLRGFGLVRISGTSMNNTLKSGDVVLVTRYDCQSDRPPEFGDVVECRFPGREDTYIKRVIGLPGETVQIIDSVIYINGESLEENYGQGVYFLAGSAADPVVLGDDEYFVLGDNRNNSIDSRYAVGKVKREQITGRAVFRFWPFSSFGSLKGR